jgi:hypothetical protein
MALILVTGCAPPGEPAPGLGGQRSRPGAVRDDAGDSGRFHDFGPVLATGQTLSHTFRLRNASARPLAIRGARAQAPCCSAIGPVPDSVPVGGEVAVPVRFEPGFQAGPRQVSFLVETDDPTEPLRDFTLRASLTPAFEVEPLDVAPSILALGEASRRRFRVTCRRTAQEGRAAPVALNLAPPLTAVFATPSDETTLPGGLVQAVREIEVAIPASNTIGPARGEVVLAWADGSTHALPLAWQVRPSVVAVPSGLALATGPEPAARVVRVISRDESVRVLAVSGPGLAEAVDLPTTASRQHEIHLHIRRDQPAPTATDIQLTTDHPLQPTVTLSVLILPEAATGDE